MQKRIGNWLLAAFVSLVLLFLLAPILAVTLGALTKSTFVVFPPHGITLKWYVGIFSQHEFLVSLGLSCEVAALSATLATGIGLMVAIPLVRRRSIASRVVWVVVMSPLLFPSIVLGLAFLEFYGMLGLGNSAWSLIAGHVVLITPFATSLAVIGLQTAKPEYEQAARSLGASPWRTLWDVTLPLIRWSLLAGWALSFVVSFGDLSIALFLASPNLITLPVRIFNALEFTPLNPSLTAISSGLVLVALAVLGLAAKVIRLDRLI